MPKRRCANRVKKTNKRPMTVECNIRTDLDRLAEKFWATAAANATLRCVSEGLRGVENPKFVRI